MRTMRMHVIGLLALSLPAALASCASDGTPPVRPGFYEVPVERTVALPRNLTEVPPLEPLPAPAYRPASGPCSEGCYTEEQVQDALDTALAWGLSLADRLWTIRLYADEAVRSEKPKE